MAKCRGKKLQIQKRAVQCRGNNSTFSTQNLDSRVEDKSVKLLMQSTGKRWASMFRAATRKRRQTPKERYLVHIIFAGLHQLEINIYAFYAVNWIQTFWNSPLAFYSRSRFFSDEINVSWVKAVFHPNPNAGDDCHPSWNDRICQNLWWLCQGQVSGFLQTLFLQ